ncbi:MAG: NAD(P)-binding oxidoreductase [Chloroflexota bacterium]
MRIAVLGATGTTGRLFVQRALANGHELTALVRSEGKLAEHPHLTTVKGNVLDLADVCRVVATQDAIFCALGTGADTSKATVRADGTQNLVTALQRIGGQPHLIVLSSLGVGESRIQMHWLVRWFVTWSLRNPLADHRSQERIVRESRLPYTILRPTALTDNPNLETSLRVSYPPEKIKAQPGVPRANVAAFALETIEQRDFLNQILTLTTA